jgi:hypothetical protein
VILALILFAVSAFGFGTWTDKLIARSLELLGTEGVQGTNYVAVTRRLMNVARVDSLVVVGILALMVFKPGA